MPEIRSLSDLLETRDPAWPLVEDWIEEATNNVQVLPATPTMRDRALLSAQVTTRSPLGAVIHETGGILVDHGWLRILGSGSAQLNRAIHTWNLGRSFHETGPAPPFYLVADDAAGGFFAMNGGAFGPDLGQVYYHAPDTLQWEPLEMAYSAFLQWCFGRNLGEWAAELRWPGWRDEVEPLPGDRAIMFYPFLFTREGSPAGSSRRAVPVAELYDMYVCRPAEVDS